MPALEQNINNLVGDLTKPGHPRYGKFIRGGDKIWYDRDVLHKQMVVDSGISVVEDSGRIRMRGDDVLDVYGISADLAMPTVEGRNKTLEIVQNAIKPINLRLFEERVQDTFDILLRQ